MSDPDDHPGGALPPDEAWGLFATAVWAWILEPAGSDVRHAMADMSEAVHDGHRPTAEQVRAARDALDRAREVVEDYHAELAPGVEPWDGGAGSTTPYGVMVDHLERGGYDVEAEYVGREAADG